MKERLLFVAPAWLKNILVSSYGYVECRKRHGRLYHQRYRSLVDVMRAGPEAVRAYQGDRLRALLTEALEYSPWYRAVFEQFGVSSGTLAHEPPFSVLSGLPFLDKTTLKTRTLEVMVADPARPVLATISTSGTTGSPMQIPFDAEGRQSTYAEWRRYHDWLGLPGHFRSARFSGRILVDPAARKPPFWVHNWADRQVFMSSYHLKDANLPAYVEKLNAFKPDLMDGYPSALHVLAQYLLNTNSRLSFTPAAVSVTAETLMDHQRYEMERAFCCKVYNQYASSEGAPWIVECQSGNYHLWLDTGVFEFINPHSLDEETDIAELVVTSFRNFKTPLIRYRIGDYVQIYKQPPVCACGAPYPVIKAIVGRNDDILFTEEKGMVGRMDPAYKGVQGIRQSKIIQHSLDRLEVLLVTEGAFDIAQRDLLLENLRNRLGRRIGIEFNFRDSISLGNTGKLKCVERRFSLRE